MDTVDTLRNRLQELHARTAETPLFNPVFQLSHDLSRRLESGALDLAAMEELVAALECEGLQARAARLRQLIAPTDPADNLARLAALLNEEDGFSEFRKRWERPLLHGVFTAHPTFLLSPAESDAVAEAALAEDPMAATVCQVPGTGPKVTLDYEHDEALAAIERAGAARDRINAALLSHARTRWPGRWLDFKPLPFRFASWVGYDMDGRTDISWSTSVAYRLQEKARRLEGYAAQLAAVLPDHALVATLRGAAAHAAEMAAQFTGLGAEAGADSGALAAAANALTAEHPGKLLSLAPIITALEAEAKGAEGDAAIALAVLAGAMRADGL
ncbi:MAG: phosphoenolpyruvate carboxylase, partial [Novosphingobium sp.]|nr:phosphoenolpyruvate carboxylase [Novosphingobium sp.]MBY0392210.1 phosphoenolpyruvate carboxylase [Novosphingobium sp.]